jgi:hypothetical protein
MSVLFQESVSVRGVGSAENAKFIPESPSEIFERHFLVIHIKNCAVLVVVEKLHEFSSSGH